MPGVELKVSKREVPLITGGRGVLVSTEAAANGVDGLVLGFSTKREVFAHKAAKLVESCCF